MVGANNNKDDEKNSDILGAERTIEFFHMVQISKDVSGVDVEALVSELTDIPETERWLKLESNNERLDCWYEGKGTHLHRFKLGITRSKIRDKKLDTITGKTSKIGFLNTEELCCESHLIVFPNNLVGFEYNPVGPRLSQLSEFLDKKCPRLGRLRFAVAANKDFDENLKRVKRFNSISFTVNDGNADLYRRADKSYYELIEKERNRTGAKRIKIVYFSGKGENAVTKFGQKVAKKVFKMSSDDPSLDDEKVFKQMQIKFDGPEQEDAVKRSIINLTCSKITAKKWIAFSKPVTDKNVDSTAAYASIREAYDESIERLKTSKAVL